nr:uncharacterized protein LOC128693745 [Cherax quadricarinatus]
MTEKLCLRERIEEIWRAGEELGLTCTDIDNVFTSVFREEREKEAIRANSQNLKDNNGGKKRGLWKVGSYLKMATKFIVCFALLCTVIFLVISLHNPTRKFVTRNIQDMIYPVMTMLRYIALPLLAKYPYLTQWYSEECLVANTFFDQLNINCTSCSENLQLVKVSDLSNFTDVYYNNGQVLIVTDAVLHETSWMDLAEKIDINQEAELGALKVFSKSEVNANYLQQIVKREAISSDIHIEWKINKLETLHIVRQIFPRLYFIPSETEVALYRFLFTDGPDSHSYHLPLTEFANVVLVQGEGSSSLTLFPSHHCENTCNSISVTLEATQVLFFNWIYWRPVRVGGRHISTLAMSSFY